MAANLMQKRTAVVLGMLMAIGAACAQGVGIATMQAGTISHTTASAMAKVLKEHGGMDALVRPTAGESVAISMVAQGNAEFGLANMPEFASSVQSGAYGDLRLVGAVHPLRVAFFVKNDSPVRSVSDLGGKRVPTGYAAMRVIDSVTQAILATGGLSENDIRPVAVPNVLRSAESFQSGDADVFYFALGAPKVHEVDVALGGIRALPIPDSPGIEGARRVLPQGYVTTVSPRTGLDGVSQPLKVYTFDNLLFTHAKVPDEVVFRALETLVAHQADLVAAQPAMREFSAARLHLAVNLPYHPGALKFFRAKGLQPVAVQ